MPFKNVLKRLNNLLVSSYCNFKRCHFSVYLKDVRIVKVKLKLKYSFKMKKVTANDQYYRIIQTR